MIKFNKERVCAMKLFLQHPSLRVAYYTGIGVIYVFGVTALIRALLAVVAAFH